MVQTLGNYKPLFYAQEALKHLQNNLGMANRVHRGFDAERRTFDQGDQIKIRRPSKFQVQAAPGTADDLITENVTITLDQWQTVKFTLSDQELAYTDDRVIQDHISPAAYALANKIDEDGVALTGTIGPQFAQATPGAGNIVVDDMLQTRARLFDNGVPLSDGQLHFMVDGAAEAKLLGIQQFSQFQGAGMEGVETQKTGSLGTKYGMEVFANQNAGATATPGTVAIGADQAGATTSAYEVGATSIAVNLFTAAETVVEGDEITFAGHPAHYTVSATAVVGASGTMILKEGLIYPVGSGEVVTVQDQATALTALPLFHKNWAALAFARLPDMANELGANVVSIQDPVTGLAIRSRIYYVGQSSAIEVALDVLYGWKEINSMFAAKLLY